MSIEVLGCTKSGQKSDLFIKWTLPFYDYIYVLDNYELKSQTYHILRFFKNYFAFTFCINFNFNTDLEISMNKTIWIKKVGLSIWGPKTYLDRKSIQIRNNNKKFFFYKIVWYSVFDKPSGKENFNYFTLYVNSLKSKKYLENFRKSLDIIYCGNLLNHKLLIFELNSAILIRFINHEEELNNKIIILYILILCFSRGLSREEFVMAINNPLVKNPKLN